MKIRRFCFAADYEDWISKCSDIKIDIKRRQPNSPSGRERAFPGHSCPGKAVFRAEH